jgi:hypothetical protein
MRWLLALSLAACATSTPDIEKERSDLLRELREAHGDANLVADGRHYMVKPGVLQPEIRAFTVALAETLESDRGGGRDSRWVTGDEPVIAEPWLERGLRVNDIVAERVGTDPDACWRFWSERRSDHFIEEVRTTHALDAAFDGLAGAARAAAAFTDAFGAVGELSSPGSRGISSTSSSPPAGGPQ